MSLQVGHLQQPAHVLGVVRTLVQGEEVGQQALHDVANLGGVTACSK